MKRVFISIISTLLAVVLLASCDKSFGFVYDVSADGDAAGDVELTFPNGMFTGDGTAAILFNWSNDTTKVLNEATALNLEQAHVVYEGKKLKAVEAVEAWFDDNFTVAGGDYDVTISAYVKETLTGIEVKFNRRFTNREN